MTYHVRIENTQGSVFAVGENAVAQGVVGPSAAEVAEARAVLERELATLRAGLEGQPTSGHARAAVRVEDLQEVVASPEPADGEAGRAWDRVRTALAALGVTGAVAFGADLAQIASSVGLLP